MIFRTFDNDIDGIINKIGILKHTFGEINNEFKIGGISSVKDLFFGGITDSDIEKIRKYNSLVTAYQEGLPEGVSAQTAWNRTMLDASTAAQRLVESNNGAVVSEEALTLATQQQTLSAKAATVATKALAVAGNMIAFSLISKGIELAVTVIDQVANSAKYTKENVEELVSTFNSASETASSHKNTIDEISTRYEELSKGVNLLGENVSLTTEEYAEYNDIVNKIADMYPNLVAGHTSEGNALLTLRGNVEALTQAYREEQKAAAAAIIAPTDKTNSSVVENYKNESVVGSGGWFDYVKNNLTGKANLSTRQKKYYIEKALNSNPEEISKYLNYEETYKIADNRDVHFDDLLKSYGLSAISSDQDIQSAIQNMKADLATYEAELEKSLSGIRAKANAYLIFDNNYDNLTDTQLRVIQSLINSIDVSVADSFNKDSDIGVYVSKIVEGIKDNKNNIADAFAYLLNFDINDTENISKTKLQIDSYIKQIADYTGLDIETVKNLFNLDEFDSLFEQYNAVLNKTKDKFQDIDVEKILKDNSINTNSELTLWNNIITSSDNAGKSIEELLSIYHQAVKDIKSGANVNANIFDLGTDIIQTNLGKLSEQIDEVQSAYSTLSSAIKEYYSDGSISIDTMQSIMALGDDWLDYLSLENGALNLDEQALENLTKARIEAMKQQTLSNLISNVSNIQTEADANEYLASTNYDAANSYEALAKAKFADAEASLKQKLESGDISQDTYDKVIEKLENDINKIYEIFDNTNFNFSSDGNVANSIETLENHANILKSVKEEYESIGKVSSSTLSSIINAYPELGKYVEQYRLGLISEKELFAELEKCYESDKNAYIQSLTEKSLMDKEFLDTMKTNYPRLFIELQRLYGEDLSGWKSIEQTKLDISADTVSQIAKLYQEFYKAMGVNDYTDFNQQVVRAAKASGNVAAGGASVFSRMYTPEHFEKVVSETDATLNGNKINDAYNQLQNNISNVLSQAEAMKGALDKYNTDVFNSVNDRFDFSWDTLADSDSSSTSQTAEKLNWIERLINKISTAYNRLKNVVSNTAETWLNRNNALSDSMQVLLSEIDAQSKAYDYYMNLFNSYGLDEYYKNQIANGSISIEVIYDDNLKEAISECIDLYDNAREAKDAVDELTQEYRSLAMTRFDNLKSEYEAQIGLIEDTVGILEAQLSLLETDGYINSKYLYNLLIEAEKENLKNLNAEYAALSSKINTVEEGSENWYSMKTDINSVSEAIINATDSLKGYENELRQIEWDLFDRTRDDVADLIDESDFLYGILEDKGFYDDGGNLNRYGQAARAMLAQKYELYASQSKAYADEVKKIDEELAKDPYDTALLDRRQELIKLQQESVQSALDEKNALKDLISDGYEEYKNSLDDIISKHKDMLSAIKDTYDYEKNIAELTDNLAVLEKQYRAYQGDSSESGRKNVQQLKTELEEARQDLKETEYEKLISDTEKLLDEFQTDVDEWLNERLDHLDALISDVISQSNANTGAIAGAINEAADSVGYTLSDNMNGIWAVYSGNITNAMSETGNEFTSGQSALHETVKNIGDSVLALLKYADEEAAGLIAEQGSQANGGADTGSQTEYETNAWENPVSGGGSEGDAGSSDWSIYKYYYPQDLNVDTSVVDRLKSNNIDASFDARSRYWDMLIGDGEYYSTYEQNVRLLNWLKNNGYAKGSRRILFDQLGLTQERGQELIFSKTLGGMITPLRRGDKVFTSEMTENLWKLAQKPVVPDFNLGDTQFPYIGQQNMSNDVKVSFGDVSVTLPNVKNYIDFMREAQKDPDFTKMVQNIALGKAFGKNTYDRYVY